MKTGLSGFARPLNWVFVVLGFVIVGTIGNAEAQMRRLPTVAGDGETGRRLALVIGNDAYAAAPLKNAVNDSRLMATVLKDAGFDVTAVHDVDQVGMERAFEGLSGRVKPGDWVFVFYAGHGIQLEGLNYLLPVDFEAGDSITAKRKSIPAEEIRERLVSGGARVGVIVLDACRDNPFKATRGGTRGLSKMEPARGTLIALATGPGQTASDNPGGRNGLFTEKLAAAMRVKGLGLREVFQRTREAVDEASGRKQRPWVLEDLTGGDVYMFGGGAVAGKEAEPATSAPAPAGVDVKALDLAYWQAIQGGAAEGYRSYLGKYPNGEFAIPAKLKLKQLASPAAAPTSVAVAQNSGTGGQIPGGGTSGSGAGGRRAGEVRRSGVDGLEYVWIPPGEFEMGCATAVDSECNGDEQPAHHVRLTKGYWLGKTEVTVAAFRKYVESTGYRTDAEKEGSASAFSGTEWEEKAGASWRSPGFEQGAEHPAVDVSWNDAEGYCRWSGGRLPTEAEWENAARGGHEGWKYVWGNGGTPQDGGKKQANVADESAKRIYPGWPWPIFAGYDDGYANTAPVGSFEGNDYGLKDVAGNVWEWCADWYDEKYYERRVGEDPVGAGDGKYRVLRGGAWGYSPGFLRLSCRFRFTPANRSVSFGLRCARDGNP